MSQSNVDNLRRQCENYSEAAKYEFGSKPSNTASSSGHEGTFTEKLQGAINDANNWNNNGSSSGSGFGSGSGLGMNFDYNDNDYGNYGNDNDD